MTKEKHQKTKEKKRYAAMCSATLVGFIGMVAGIIVSIVGACGLSADWGLPVVCIGGAMIFVFFGFAFICSKIGERYRWKIFAERGVSVSEDSYYIGRYHILHGIQGNVVLTFTPNGVLYHKENDNDRAEDTVYPYGEIEIYRFVRKKGKNNGAAYWVCPFVFDPFAEYEPKDFDYDGETFFWLEERGFGIEEDRFGKTVEKFALPVTEICFKQKRQEKLKEFRAGKPFSQCAVVFYQNGIGLREKKHFEYFHVWETLRRARRMSVGEKTALVLDFGYEAFAFLEIEGVYAYLREHYAEKCKG